MSYVDVMKDLKKKFLLYPLQTYLTRRPRFFSKNFKFYIKKILLLNLLSRSSLGLSPPIDTTPVGNTRTISFNAILLVLIQMMDNQVTVTSSINLKSFNIIISKKNIIKLAKEEVRKNSCQTNSYWLVSERKIEKSRKRKKNEKTYKRITYKKYIKYKFLNKKQ